MRVQFLITNLVCILSCIIAGKCLFIWSDRQAYRTGSNYVGQLPPVPKQDCNKSAQTQQSFTQVIAQSIITSSQIACFPPRVLNPRTSVCECLFGTEYYAQTNHCLCPIDRPLWTGSGCITCNNSGESSFEKIGCISCPQGFVVRSSNGQAFCQPVD